MLRSLRNTRRLLAIALILAREDALFIFDELRIAPVAAMVGTLFKRRREGKRKGERLASALHRLGPAFIKLGQALSTRSDLIGEEVANDLGSLRDKLPPFPTDVARAIIEDEFKLPVSSLFAEFADRPVAAASIAQVHKAVTIDGRKVAVKILRPDIQAAFERDLDLFFWIAEVMEHRVEASRRLKPLEVVRTLRESVFFELDLRFEAAAGTELAANLRRYEPGFRVPDVFWALTSRRVLTTEWIDGTPISDVASLRAAGFNLDDIISKAARGLFSQVFKDGFFHADLHPGNLFIDRQGDIVAVDFGIMGRLDWNSRIYIAEILRGFIEEDYRHVAEMHFTAGYVPRGKSIEAFTQACMAVAKPITGKPLNEISVANLLGQMFKIAAEFEMETQPQLLLLQKTMMVTEGVGRMLNPALNMWEMAAPLIGEWASEHFGIKGKVKDAARQGYDIARKLPVVLEQFEQTLQHFSNPEGVRLHPGSIAGMNRHKRHAQLQWLWLGWAALGTFSVAALLLLTK